jgi:UDP-N-acetylmuramyl pentapeptide phosphotransferase/UDP-N-acetylglucosamine-1-phosphate transferase
MTQQLTAKWWLEGAVTVASAAVLCALLIVILRPLLERHALAKPNARSSHATPTPQGGGIAVIAATVAIASLSLYCSAGAVEPRLLVALFASAIFVACVGAADDIRSIEVAPRLLLQTLAVASVIYVLPAEMRIVPTLPWWIERALLVTGGLWFVNLVNFMDGLDWMTVAEVVPITATLGLMGAFGQLPPQETAIALSLCGAAIGFAYFNRPVARLFLGDVGSLPIGLLLGWLLLHLAANGHLAAAILMPLYYLADATITLIRRLFRDEPVWHAHRSHFYQLATDRGFTVIGVVAWVFAVNIGLCALAIVIAIWPSRSIEIAALAAGVLLVACELFAFTRGLKSSN